MLHIFKVRQLLLLTIISFTITIRGYSQKLSLESIAKQHTQHNAIILSQTNNYFITITEDNTIVIKREYNKKKLFLSDQNNISPEDFYYFNSFSTITSAKAYAYNFDKKKNNKAEVKNIFERTEYDNNIFYNDTKYLQVIYPKTQKGTITDFSVTETIKDPHFLEKHFFAGYFPVIEDIMQVEYPKTMTIDYRMYNIDSSKVRITKIETANTYILTWTTNNVDAIKNDRETFSLFYYEPHVEFFIDSYKNKNNEPQHVLSSVTDLYRWYYSLIDSTQNKDFPLLNAQTDSIIQNCITELEKAKAIYYWVQENIKYVAFEEGYRGYVPHNAQSVYSKRYGDCKDMTSILVYMLKYAKIDAHFCWIGTRTLPYSYYDLPTPSVDNHMICATHIKNTWYFLDGTARMLSISLPSASIQGKEGLIGYNKDSFAIVKVPVISVSHNKIIDSCFISLENATLKGTTKITLSGYPKYYSSVVLNSTPNNKYASVLKDEYLRGSNKFTIDSIISTTGIANRDTVSEFSFAFSIPSYVKKVNNKLYLNLNLTKKLYNTKIDSCNHRIYNEFIQYAWNQSYYYNVAIPKGYTVNYIPANSTYKSDLFSASIEYNIVNNTIEMKCAININTIEIPKQQFMQWNEMIDILAKAYSSSIVLSEINK